MASKNINLLPKELTVSKGVLETTTKLTQFSYAAIFFFVLVLASGGGAFYYFNNKLTKLIENQDRLKQNIQSLQETEQQIILTKDRIAKIKVILDGRQNEKTFAKHKTVVDNLPETMILDSAQIDVSNSEIAFQARDSRQLVNFMSSLLARADTLNVVLGSLTFNAFQGYDLVLEIF